MTDPSGLTLLVRVVPALALLVGALLLTRRLARRGGSARLHGGGLRVLARTALSRGAVVAVVEVAGRRLLLGAGDQGITLLTELDTGESLDGAADAAAPSGATGTPAWLPPAPTERRRTAPDRPWMGLVDRLRALTVRTHLERPVRARLG